MFAMLSVCMNCGIGIKYKKLSFFHCFEMLVYDLAHKYSPTCTEDF